MADLTVLSALLIGVLGSTHCLGMCSGLAAVTAQGAKGAMGIVTYNVGRLLTYMLLGALLGWFGEQLLQLMPKLTFVLRVVAGLLLIAMGLYISRWWLGLTRLEQLGAYAWRQVQPLTRRLLPIRNYRQMLLAGMLWGLLPCGLVYSTLAWALATADWQQSALLMLAFGVGTLPAMIGVGLLNKMVQDYLRGKFFRSVAGVIVILMGIWMLLAPLMHGDHGKAHQHSEDGTPMHHQH